MEKKTQNKQGVGYSIYENRLNKEFYSPRIKQKWCTDLNYLSLTNGFKQYNCAIKSHYNRSVVASITDRKITTNLARRTQQKAIEIAE